MDFAQAAEMCNRTPGQMATAPPDGQAGELLARPRALADGSVAVEARLLTAEAFNGDDIDPVTASWPSGPSRWPAGPATRSSRARRLTSSPRSSWPAAS